MRPARFRARPCRHSSWASVLLRPKEIEPLERHIELLDSADLAGLEDDVFRSRVRGRPPDGCLQLSKRHCIVDEVERDLRAKVLASEP